jgi:hypothetical protein
MELNEFFSRLAAIYDRTQPFDSDCQRFINNAPQLLSKYIPATLEMKSSGGKGVPTLTPWVGFFDPGETDTPQEGIYVVYILSADKEVLNLLLGQGQEYLGKQHGDKEARRILAEDAEIIRNEMSKEFTSVPNEQIDLRSKGRRQRSYSASSITSIVYEVAQLPAEDILADDLTNMLDFYGSAVSTKKRLLLTQPGKISSPTKTETSYEGDRKLSFQPKNSDDYSVLIQERLQTRTRTHEKLLLNFGEFAEHLGFQLDTPHPQDLVLHKNGESILIEAKMVYHHDSRNAVRSVIGQLFDYRHFIYTSNERKAPKLIALFSEPIGEAYVSFLEIQGIGSICFEPGDWVLSPLARHFLLNETYP